MPETVPCAVCSAELTDAVPVIAAWMAVQIACDTIEGRFTSGVERLPCSLVLRESSRPRTQAPIAALREPAS